MLINFDSLKTFYSALKQKIKNSRGNWEQNDPAADDYIKNKPFYSEGVQKVTYIPEQNLEGFDVFSEFLYAVINPFSFTPTIGSTYEVVWDNNVYEVTASDGQGVLYMGNENYVAMTSGGDIPFTIVFTDMDLFVVTESTEASHKFGISATQEMIHKIDPKYLPDSISMPDNVITEDNFYDALEGNLAPVAFSNNYNDLNNTPNLASVATSGNYNDLSNKPVIPEQEQANLSETDDTQVSYIKGVIRQESLPEGYPYVQYTASELVSTIARGTMTVTKKSDGTFSKTTSAIPTLGASSFTNENKYIIKVGNNECLCVWKFRGSGYLYATDDSVFDRNKILTTYTNGDVNINYHTLSSLTSDIEGTYEWGIYKTTETYTTISEQYIPDTIATKNDFNVLSTLVGETPVSDQIDNAIAEIGLPEITTDNDGQILGVVDGAWATIDTPQGGSGGTSVQSDYAQNDETAANYIKNRPFYEDGLTLTNVFNGVDLPFVYEPSFGIYAYGDIAPVEYVKLWEQDWETVTIVWDGQEYVCEPAMWNGLKIAGNAPALTGTGNNNMPFVFGIGGLALFERNQILVASLFDTAPATHKVALYMNQPNYVTLDSNYLDVPWEKVNNKPFGDIKAGTVVVEETSLPVEYLYGANIIRGFKINEPYVVVGKHYNVTLNGTTYDAECVEESGMKIIRWQIGSSTQDLTPYYPALQTSVFLPRGLDTSVGNIMTIKVELAEDVVAKIDSKYLPEISSGGSGECNLPDVTTADNDKFLQVVNGVWTAVKIELAEGGDF